jgi:hypothetical protein
MFKRVIEAIDANEHLELYDRCTSQPKRVNDLKLETNKIRLEDTVAAEVEKKLKSMNIGTQQIAQVLPAQASTCEICNRPHHTVYCFATP